MVWRVILTRNGRGITKFFVSNFLTTRTSLLSVPLNTHHRYFSNPSSLTTNAVSTPNLRDGITFLHPADSATVRMDIAHKNGILHYPVSLTFTTPNLLTPHLCRKTLNILMRKVPPLRMCLRMKEGQLWVCETTESVEPNLQVVETEDVVGEMRKLMDEKLGDSTVAPLWRARVLLHPVYNVTNTGIGRVNPEEESEDMTYNDRELEGLVKGRYFDASKGSISFSVTFILLFHHGLIDGTSAWLVMNTLLKVISVLAAEKEIKDNVGVEIQNEKEREQRSYFFEQEVGQLESDWQTRKLLTPVRKELEQDTRKLSLLVNQRIHQTFVPLLTEAFGEVVNSEGTQSKGRTNYLHNTELDGVTLWRFTRACRASGLTFNAGFTAALNMALVKMVREDGGLTRETYPVTSRHAVNLRRYWENQSTKSWSFGCHMAGFLHKSPSTPLHIKEFWPYAATIHKELRHAIGDSHALEELVVKEVMAEKQLEEGSVGWKPSAVVCDYFLSNLYSGSTSISSSPSSDLPKTSSTSYFCPTGISCFTYHHGSEYSVCHIITPMGNALTHSMSFTNTAMRPETALLLLHYLNTVLRALTN